MKTFLLTLLCVIFSVYAKADSTDSISVEYKFHLATYYYKIMKDGDVRYYSLYMKNKQDLGTIENVGSVLTEEDYNKVPAEVSVMNIANKEYNYGLNEIDLDEPSESNKRMRFFAVKAGYTWVHFDDDYYGTFNYNGSKLKTGAYGFGVYMAGDYQLGNSLFFASVGVGFSMARASAEASFMQYKVKTELSSSAISVPIGLKYYIKLSDGLYFTPEVGIGMLYTFANFKMEFPSMSEQRYHNDSFSFLYYSGVEFIYKKFLFGGMIYPSPSSKTTTYTIRLGIAL